MPLAHLDKEKTTLTSSTMQSVVSFPCFLYTAHGAMGRAWQRTIRNRTTVAPAVAQIRQVAKPQVGEETVRDVQGAWGL